MKNSINIVFLLLLFTCISGQAQWQYSDESVDLIPDYGSDKKLPEISKDSTQLEIISHIEATLDWMEKEHYKFSYASPLIYSETALFLADKIEDKSYLYKVRAILGNSMLRVKDTANAKALFLESLKDAIVAKDSVYIMATKGNLANAYYYTGNYNHKAIANYIDGAAIAKKLEDTSRTFIMHHNVSRIFIENKDIENSKYHITESAKYLQYLDNPFFESGQLRNEGMLYVLQNQPDLAIEKFKENIEIAENNNAMEGIIEGHQGYIEALELKNDYKGIYEINKKLKVYTDKQEEDDQNQTIEAVKARLNVVRYKEQIKSKELEKELLESEADSKGILLFLVLGVLIFISIIFLQTYQSNKKRKLLIAGLRDKNRQYLEAKKQSDKLTKTKSKFFATVSHELRTPLYGVIGLSSILLENKDLKKYKKDLKSLKFSANYLLALINDLLQFNKIENNSFTEDVVTFNIKDLTSTIVTSFEYIRQQHQNSITINIDESVPKLLKGNSVRLSQILINLIGNACKFTEKGIITIDINTLQIIDNSVKIQIIIKDTGPGIEKHKLSEIFNEFTQYVDSSTSYKGTGLGLSIVKKLVEQANGTITVESEIGKGTAFVLNLEIESVLESESIVIQPILDFGQLENKHILIVEDNRINQSVTKRILQNSGITCNIAQNGEEAISQVQKNHYDLVLMDINMPVKNGIEATREIRRFNTQIPIIALTAVEIEEQKQQIFDSGMNDIILKPYDIELFKKAILANLLSNPSSDS